MNSPDLVGYLYISLDASSSERIIESFNTILTHLGFRTHRFFYSANPDLRAVQLDHEVLFRDIARASSIFKECTWFCIDDTWERYSRMWRFNLRVDIDRKAVVLKLEPRVNSLGLCYSGDRTWLEELISLLNLRAISLYENGTLENIIKGPKIEIHGVVGWTILHASAIFNIKLSLEEIKMAFDHSEIVSFTLRRSETMSFIRSWRENHGGKAKPPTSI